MVVTAALLGLGLLDAEPTSAQAGATATATRTQKARPSATPTLNGSGQISAPPTQTPMAADEDANTEYFADFLVVRYKPQTQDFVHRAGRSFRQDCHWQPTECGGGSAGHADAHSNRASARPCRAARKNYFQVSADGGSYPEEYLYYSMNPDGTGIERLDTKQTRELLTVIQGLEGFSPDRTKVVMGNHTCGTYYENTCQLYILDASENAKMIFSDAEPSQGLWFGQTNVRAKEPVWSPAR